METEEDPDISGEGLEDLLTGSNEGEGQEAVKDEEEPSDTSTPNTEPDLAMYKDEPGIFDQGETPADLMLQWNETLQEIVDKFRSPEKFLMIINHV